MRSPQFPGLTLERLPFDEDTAKYELRLNLQDTEQGITGQFEYSTDLFDVATIARMAEHWIMLLESIVVNTGQRLSEISLLTENEHQQFQIWNQTTQEYPSHQCLHQLLNSPLPKYRYASAGSLYPVQTYIYIKPNRVQNLAAGIYYYHPQKHKLIHLSNSAKVDSGIYGINQEIFAQAAFALFLIGDRKPLAICSPSRGAKHP